MHDDQNLVADTVCVGNAASSHVPVKSGAASLVGAAPERPVLPLVLQSMRASSFGVPSDAAVTLRASRLTVFWGMAPGGTWLAIATVTGGPIPAAG